MALSSDLISQFVKITNDEVNKNTETTSYGKIVKQGDQEYVQLDGSDLLTPISSTTVVHDGDRVMVTIKNHTAIVTGDLTTPSASSSDVTEIGNKITEFEIVIADKVTTEQLEAEIAKIDKLITDEIDAVNGKFETIEVEVAKIDKIETDMVEVSGKVEAHEGEFTTLRADIVAFTNATVDELNAIDGEFRSLKSDYADFENTVTNTLTAYEADIKDLTANSLTVNEADLRYANIDFSNIGEAAIEKLFTESGIIEDLIMSDGKVTGHLVGVTITGDLIEGNTVKADKLVIQGEDGLYYKLNVNSLGEATASSDEKFQNGLDGSVIIAESITAEKIAVDDLVAFGATIGGFHIDNHAIYSGVKSSVDNTTQGVFLGDDGQMNFGDLNNFFKFYVDEDGKYKLEIQADTIRFGVNGTNIEEALGGSRGILSEVVYYGLSTSEDTKPISIPDEYQPLEYLETTGTQYIDINFVPNQNTRVVTELYLPSTDNNIIIFGSGYGSGNTAYETFTWNGIEENYGNVYGFISPIYANEKFKLDKNKNNTTISWADGSVSRLSQINQEFTSPYSMAIFATNRGNYVTGTNAGLRVYSFKVYDDGVLIRNLSPCYRKSDMVAGMYDTQNNVFYANSGSGEFIKSEGVAIDGGYSTEIPIMSETDRCLWSYKVTTYTDGTFVKSEPVVIGVYGKSAYQLWLEAGNTGTEEDYLNSLQPDTEEIYAEIYNQRTDIIATTEALILAATAEYVKTGDFETYQETVKAQLEVMAEDVTIKFTKNSTDITNLQNTTSSEFETIKKYFQFEEDGLKIGGDESAIKLQIDNDEGIIFTKNGEQFGYWDGNDFYTGNIVVRTNERAQFGKYAYVPRSDGSLMFLKVK